MSTLPSDCAASQLKGVDHDLFTVYEVRRTTQQAERLIVCTHTAIVNTFLFPVGFCIKQNKMSLCIFTCLGKGVSVATQHLWCDFDIALGCVAV